MEPLKDSHGLPGLPVRVSFEFTPHGHAVIEMALKKVALRAFVWSQMQTRSC